MAVRLWKGFMPVVSRRFTRTRRGVRVAYRARGSTSWTRGRGSSSTRFVRDVKLAPISRGRLQARVTRAPALKLTKFWQNNTVMVAHSSSFETGFNRNVKVCNLVSLGNNVFQRVGNRIRLDSMLLNITVNAPYPRATGIGAYFFGSHPSDPNLPGGVDKHSDTVRFAQSFPKYNVSMCLVWVPHPRTSVPVAAPWTCHDPASFDYGSSRFVAGPRGVADIEDFGGVRMIWRKTFSVSLSLNHNSLLTSVNPADVDPVYYFGPSAMVQEHFYIPLSGLFTRYQPTVTDPVYGSIEYGALLLYAITNIDGAVGGDGLPKVAFFARTAFTDIT